MASEFRIQVVAIEGFKGFTTRKEIDLRERHTFLLGQNGKGKSSIVEAIRWGLFGSTRRPGEIIANSGYAGRCRVEITLMREGKKWHLRRTLLRGVSGGTDVTLTDENRQEHPLGEIMPQLESSDAGEGMHVIFASQSGQLRRQPENLTPFARTVFNYLGLTHPRALLSQLENFLTEQENIENALSAKLTESRSNTDNGIKDLTAQRGRILATPPWEGSHTPPIAETEARARTLIEEISGAPPDESLSGVSLEALIDHAEGALSSRNEQGMSELKKEIEEKDRRLSHLRGLSNVQERIEAQISGVEIIQAKLNATLEDKSLDALRKKVDEERVAADTIHLRRQIVEYSISLLDRDEAETVLCPSCGSEHHRHDLEMKLKQTASQVSGNPTSLLGQLETSLKQAAELEQEMLDAQSKLTTLEGGARVWRRLIDKDDGKEFPEYVDADQIKAMIDSLLESKSSLDAQISGQGVWLNENKVKLSQLKGEGKFHRIQEELSRLQKSSNRIEQARRAYDELVSFGESVRMIQKAVGVCLTERLKGECPNLSDKLTHAFVALTHHPWFDQLVIDQDKLPNLEMQVASSQDPYGLGQSTAVLNGQAASALILVPYFAFSQEDDAPTEVYLVMLDDPTQAFDEEHIGTLVERLNELGRSVQLIVASQETDRFRSLLPKYFERESYVIIEPNEWSYQSGPELTLEYGNTGGS